MRHECGAVVKSLKGHDSGSYYVIISTDEKNVYVANGKTKKIALPKCKNPKHIEVLDKHIDLNGITDKVLRKELNIFKKISKV